ncbi:MAG: hypothetical protein K9I99_03800 [Melioribacteraceae bacterium]|nr:hypothetical protein [Melioribacteraceae bacterium]
MDSEVEEKKYEINEKTFILQTDFTYDELDWLNSVLDRLQGKGNEVRGSFTRDEIKKTLKLILRCEDGTAFGDVDFGKTKETLAVKIIADFFLMKAILGAITQQFSKLSERGKNKLSILRMN